jgi:monoterpene epsilon-lactone hydrolase
MTQSGETSRTNAGTNVPNCSKEYLDFWGGKYLSGVDPLSDPYVSPNHCDLRGLCPLLVQVGGGETMLDMAAELSHRAARARVEVALEVYDMEGHVLCASNACMHCA